MSYCRFTEGDVYAYECEGGVQFWTPRADLDRLCSTYGEAYQYAKALRDKHGLDVPGHAIEALWVDAFQEITHGIGLLPELVRDINLDKDIHESYVKPLLSEWLKFEEPFGKLKAENAKLKAENARLKVENAKLLQLFQDFWAWVAPPFGVGGGSPDEYVSIVERMHEMGLVVKQ
ncbi:MAG: hypothetical protein IJ203_09295 [Atopobiaceae bacterium]|nr:hypothetical protein [Atopobiaceae bacterium]